MKFLIKMSPVIFLLFFSTCKNRIPQSTPILPGAFVPPAPEGFHWEVNPAFSDEFEGEKLDKTKWYDRSPYWRNGRPPATFRAEMVSVKDGMLQIKNQPLIPATEKYNIQGGAVASVSKEALYGYFEARMKASSISMSSTFWMKNKPVDPKGCPRSQDELDIVEAIGMRKRGQDMNHTRRANSHIFKWDCNDELKVLSAGNSAPMSPPANEVFHTFGCWWVDANTLKFYLDGEHQFTVNPKEPFDRSMYMHMVTETYNWEDPPTKEELLNDEINTTYYDWVRSYKLVKN